MHKQKSSKSTLFLMELMIAILMFSLCAAVCLSLFGASRTMTDDSDNLNHAVALSKSAASCYKAANGDLTVTAQLMYGAEAGIVNETTDKMIFYYDGHWNPAKHFVEDGFYLQIENDSKNDNLLREAMITVCHADQTQIFQLQVKKAVTDVGGEPHASR